MAETPAEIRTTIRAARNFLPPGFCYDASQQIVANALAAKPVQRAQRLAAYCAVGSEANPMSALADRHQQGAACYLPLMTRESTLLFGRWNPKDTLIPNRFGIPQPSSADHLAAEQLDLILAPLVAFDLSGNRLGMGGGYYDRTLAFLRDQARPGRPMFVGVGYGMQQVDQLPPAEWDVPLDAVITENGWVDFSDSN